MAPHADRDVDARGRSVGRPHSGAILACLAVGLAIGVLLNQADRDLQQRFLAFADPIGRLWLDALTMTIVPLVFSLLFTGVGTAVTSATAGGVARRAVVWFCLLLLGACAVAAGAAMLALAWAPVPPDAAALRFGGGPPAQAQPQDWVSGIIPSNPIKAASETAMAPLVVFAVIFGLAATQIDRALRAGLDVFFRAVVATMLVIVRWVLVAAPLGVLALAIGVGVRLGTGAASALLHYIVLIAAVCLLITVLAYAAATWFGGISLITFARAALPAQAVALSTQSSLASLPAMIGAAPALRTAAPAAAIVLPLAVSIFRAASAAANIAVAVYLAHLHGIALTPATIAIGVIIAAAVSVAAVGLPAQVSFFTTIGPVCLAMGIPLAALPLLLAVETLPDIFRTLGNVTADLAVTRIAGRGLALDGVHIPPRSDPPDLAPPGEVSQPPAEPQTASQAGPPKPAPPARERASP